MRRRHARIAGTIAVLTTALATYAASDTRGPVGGGQAGSAPIARPLCTGTNPSFAPPNAMCNGISVSATPSQLLTVMGGSAQTIAMATGDTGESLVRAVISGDITGWSFGSDPTCTRADGSGTLVCTYAGAALAHNIPLVCSPPDQAVHAVMLAVTGDDVLSGSADGSAVALSCSGSGARVDLGHIQVALDGGMQTLHTGQVGSATAQITAAGPDHLVHATLAGGSDLSMFAFADAQCVVDGGTECALAAPIALGSAALGVRCTPTTLGTHTASVEVFGDGSGSDVAAATFTCTGTGDAGLPTIGAGSGPFVITTAVGSAGSAAIPVADLASSGSDLVLGAALTAPSPLFTLETCAGPDSCTLGPSQGSAIVVSYLPVHWGSGDVVTVQIDSNDGSDATLTREVTGVALGGELHVSPASGTALGPVPIGETQTVAFTLHDDGNIALATTITGVAAPFSTSALGFTIAAGSDAELDVTCGSGTPTAGSAAATITLVTPDAYLGASVPLVFTCTVADTNIQVQPTAFDFGELRVGDPAPPAQTLTITNPTTAAVSIDAIGLVRAADGLTLTAPTGPSTLAAGDTLTATLALSTKAETDLDDPHEAIAIDITEGAKKTHLELPVTGEVGLASSTISPPRLDLGFGCVGQPVSAQVLLTNTGTGTLHVEPPMIDAAFAVADTDPTSYPSGGAALAAGGVARATVSPTSTAVGTYTGTLTWVDDVPENYAIPVALTYKATGTALSPLDLAFGTVRVGFSSTPGLVTLENCGDTPVTVDVGKIAPVNGTADAWEVLPRGPGQTIAPHAELQLGVTFAPRYADAYNASLQLVVDGAPAAVQLYGQGAGEARERTFYGCGCAGGGSPAGGLPIAGALLAISRRRRRGSS